MKILKVLSVREPEKKKYPSSYDLYEVSVDYGNGMPHTIYMNRFSYAVFVKEQELLKAGVSPKLLGEYHDAIRDEADWDNSQG